MDLFSLEISAVAAISGSGSHYYWYIHSHNNLETSSQCQWPEDGAPRLVSTVLLTAPIPGTWLASRNSSRMMAFTSKINSKNSMNTFNLLTFPYLQRNTGSEFLAFHLLQYHKAHKRGRVVVECQSNILRGPGCGGDWWDVVFPWLGRVALVNGTWRELHRDNKVRFPSKLYLQPSQALFPSHSYKLGYKQRVQSHMLRLQN